FYFQVRCLLGVKRAEPGGAVSLNCSCRDATVSFLFWYKQSPGGKPRVISTRMRHSPKADVRPAFQGRFQVAAQIQDGVNNLMITNLQPEDSGTYYCGVLEFGTTEFGQGVFLHVRNNNMNPSVHRLALKSIGLGESVNLTCDVFPERCTGEQRLCWFRDDASQRASASDSERKTKYLLLKRAIGYVMLTSTNLGKIHNYCSSSSQIP
uniref:Ig-like domain-containing protein n=1 Tax=Poecilia latipinna TaxID=48699 RepID=A0A3B3UYQ4_9TELE